MKHELITFLHPFDFSIYKKNFLWFLLILALSAMFLLPSFAIPKSSSSTSNLPFSTSISFESTAINCKINNAIAKGFIAKEASLFKMEQAEGIFAKVLNMSLEDKSGNLFALSLIDLENANLDSCITTNYFFGEEHEKSEENFSNDLGSVIFTNSSSLIFEKENGDSVISRNGWIKINRCEAGRISGDFYFELDGESLEEVLEGEFVNVLLENV